MKVKGCIRRTVAGLLIGLTLFGAYSGRYMQARECQAASMYTALYSLFEYMMASCGFAVTNKADNEVLCDAFCDWFENYHGLRGDTPSETALNELMLISKIVAGAKVKLDDYPVIKESMLTFIDHFLKSPSINKSVSSDALANYGCGSIDGDKDTYAFKGIFNYLGYSVGTGGYSDTLKTLGFYHKKNTSFKTDSNTIYNGDVVICYAFDYNKTSFHEPYPLDNKEYVDSNLVIRKYSDNSSVYTLIPFVFIFDSETKKLITSKKFSKLLDLPLSFQKFTQFSCTIFPSDRTINDISTYTEIYNSMKNIKGIYGNLDSVSSSIGNITELVAGTTPLIDSIAQTIADLDGKTLTADDINEIVADRIDAIDEIINSVQDDTEDIEQNTATTNSWLSRIYNKMDAISKSVSGSSALQLDDVTDQFKVVDGGGQPDNDDNEPPKIWGIGAFTTIKLLEPVFKFFGEPLSLITKWLNSIQKTIEKASANEVEQAVKNQQENSNAITNVIEVISDFPMKIFEQFKVTLGNIIIYLDNIATAATAGAQVLTEFPLEIVKWISEGVSEALELHPLDVTIPDVKVDVDFPPIEIPILSDILAVLEAILGAVKAFFSIDLEAIEASMEQCRDKIDGKLPFKLAKDLFNSFVFSDSYDYPIIKIQSPNIIKQFTNEEYIILFDGERYAKYFGFVRSLLAASFWVVYAYVWVCKFKVRFSLSA